MNGTHDGSTEMLGDKEWAKSFNDMLKEKVDKATRQAAKCPNFGKLDHIDGILDIYDIFQVSLEVAVECL